MKEFTIPSIDVVIPVYNAPELTRLCIDSVITYLGQSIQCVYIQDDASDIKTREMLDSLSYEQLRVHHAPINQGFGLSVNEAIARSEASYILVLNSDTEAFEDFLPLLCKMLAMDPQLAVVSPAHQHFARYDLGRYIRTPGGYIPAYRFQGHAFLIRRCIFQEIGGFDPEFGRGYFEDIDLSRRLDLRDWRIGVHPDVYIRHKGGGSFGRGRAYRALMQRNRALYLSRYPGACHNILLITDCNRLVDVSAELQAAITHVFRQGGNVHWLTPIPAPQLLCLHMRNSPANLITVIRLMLRGMFRKDKRVSAVWILPGVPRLLRVLLALFIRMRKLEVLTWETPVCGSMSSDWLSDNSSDLSSAIPQKNKISK
ncbi:MAG: glycosyltransferase family 2 protein [Nitrosomonas sp.]|nr:glycosyltransferase family 2 protein [Nitrosomonas sp.]MDP1951782.1 glycosyltransferase family 2 protein [Nitrosomonas sp.]